MLEKIKIRLVALGIIKDMEDGSQDAVLSLMISDATDAVLVYCHRKTLPRELEYLVRDIVVKTLRADNDGNIAAIKRGDTQINYATAITAEGFNQKEIAALNSFRRLRIG